MRGLENTRFSVSILTLTLACVAPSATAQALVNLAEDAADNYQDGWHTGSNGGYGFGPWQLAVRHGEENSYAGFFVARKENHPDLQNITRETAFGIYANGRAFEQAVAFRSLARPLRPGDAFSVLIEHGRIPREAGSDSSDTRSLGLVLRAGEPGESVDDFNREARFEFTYVEGKESYRILDGESPERRDSGLPITENGIELTFILVEADRYDLQVRVLETDRVHEWRGRRLSGRPGSAVEGFSIFSRDAGTLDVFFDGLQINREEEG